MRTTVTLDPDVERLLRDAMHRERKSFKRALNDAVRRGLATKEQMPTPPFKLEAFDLGVRPEFADMLPSHALEMIEEEEYRRSLAGENAPTPDDFAGR